MTVNIYINHYREEVLTERDFEDRIEKLSDEYCEDDNFFSSFLDERYTFSEIWEMDEDDKAEVRKEFYEYVRSSAIDEILEEYNRYILEV